MKTFNSSALSHNRAQVIEAAREGGAVIQMKETNGKVREEFVLLPCVTTEADEYKLVHTKGAIYGNYAGEVFKPLDFKGEGNER